MFAGHYAIGLLAARSQTRINLGVLILAAMLCDLLWCVFLLLGIEHVSYQPGFGAAHYLATWSVPYSHSLAMVVVWAALAAACASVMLRDRRAAALLFAVVLSHWFADVITDRNIPIIPGSRAAIGLNVWGSVPATLAVEGGLWLVAIVLYVKSTKARTFAGTYVFWVGVALITGLWFSNIIGPPPPNPRTVPFVTLFLFLILTGWGFWMNSARRPLPRRPA